MWTFEDESVLEYSQDSEILLSCGSDGSSGCGA